jgi:FkbM family methyltransferase
MSYSTAKEDEIALEFFGKDYRGSFLDIGAADGVLISNTRLLAENGWSGVCVEGSHRNLVGLLEAYRGRSDIQIVHAAVRGRENVGIGPWWDPIECTFNATMSHDLQSRGHERTGARLFWVYACRVQDIVKAFPLPYDYVSIDVEGVTLEVMADIDWKSMTTRMVCIEYLTEDVLGVNEVPIISDYMGQFGFKVHRVTQENVILVR